MNGVLGMAGLLLRSDLTGGQRHRVDVIKQSGENLLELLNEILDISKIESGRFEIETSNFDIRRMIDSVSALLQSRAEQKGLVYDAREDAGLPENLVGDQARLRQILINIVGNAVKFTETGEIRVSVSHEPINQDSLRSRVSVTDTGLGIAEEVRESIFEKFTQADVSTTRKFGGTGLGLAICKDLPSMMGGEIGVDSVLGEGSTFWFTSICGIGAQDGVVKASAVDLTTHFRAPENRLHLRILVAEDNPINQEIARDTLEMAGHRIDIATNGMEALEAVRRFPYDVVLMDAHMPEMDGPTATRKIRALPGRASKIPIIALTADAMVGDREKFLLAGMNDYVSKPFDPEVLFATIDRWVQQETVAVVSAPSTAPISDSADRPESSLDSAVIEPLRVGKPDLWNRLIGIYLQNTPSSLETLDRALASDDCAAVQMTAHTLKSSSANMGAGRLSELCRQLETACADANLAAGRGLFAEIRLEFNAVSAELAGESCKVAEESTA
jgi:CheY-like chemotaxis protein/HPt (histidine-containing phosphotransfer) domain-containing protein